MTILKKMILGLFITMIATTQIFAQFGNVEGNEVIAASGYYQMTTMDAAVILELMAMNNGSPLDEATQLQALQQMIAAFYQNPALVAQELQAYNQLYMTIMASGGPDAYAQQLRDQQGGYDHVYGGNPFDGQLGVEYGAMQNRLQQENSDYQYEQYLDDSYIEQEYLDYEIQQDYINDY